jgi:hypothetical protein
MPPSCLGRPGRRLCLAATLAAASTLSCGASIRALYESDVRFEHCMALDARPDVKPTLRRACWEEWASFYTFGQTRDRIDYAYLREKQLTNASDFDEGDAPTARQASVAPDPTSAIAPPPLLMAAADGGAPDAAAPEVDPEAEERRAVHARCTSDCEAASDTCNNICKTSAPCVKVCAARQLRCAARCDAKRPAR